MNETAATKFEPSPLEAAHAAKRRRDLVGEIGALTQGHDRLTGAPWAPTRAGDLLVVTYEATDADPEFVEVLEVVPSADPVAPGQTELRLVEHTSPQGDEHTAWFAGPPEFTGGDAIETAWMEAGPDRLTLIRGGRILHQGRHAQGLPATSKEEPRGFFQEGRTYSTQDGYTAPESSWLFDCRHVTTTPGDADAIAFGFVRIGRDGWTPTGFGRADWDRSPWTEERPAKDGK